MFIKTVINKKKLKEIFLLIVILGLSFLPRLWQINHYPPLIVDESANLRDINKLISPKVFLPTDYEWGFGQATLVFYPTIALIKLGISDQLFALRLTSIILSIMALIPFFYIIRNNSNTLIAFCTTLMFSFSYYYLQFSRIGWTNIHPIMLGLFLMWFTKLAINKNSLIFYFLSGITAGLLIYTYRSGEIFIFAAFILLILNIISSKKKLSIKIVRFLLFLAIFTLVSLPWMNKIFSDWNLYNLRANVVSINNAERPYHNLYNQREIIQYQILTTFKSWILLDTINGNGGNIENSRYLPLRYPLISPILIPFFWTGIIISLKKWKKSFIWFFIFLSGLVFGQVLTVDPPNGSRGLILLPIIYIFIGYSFNWLSNLMRNFQWTNLSYISISLIVAITDYFYYQYWMTWIKV